MAKQTYAAFVLTQCFWYMGSLVLCMFTALFLYKSWTEVFSVLLLGAKSKADDRMRTITMQKQMRESKDTTLTLTTLTLATPTPEDTAKTSSNSSILYTATSTASRSMSPSPSPTSPTRVKDVELGGVIRLKAPAPTAATMVSRRRRKRSYSREEINKLRRARIMRNPVAVTCLCFLASCVCAVGGDCVGLFTANVGRCNARDVKLAACFYQISKALMYSCFLLRLYSVFKSSQYKYSLRFILGIAVPMWFVQLYLILSNAMRVRVRRTDSKHKYGDCAALIPPINILLALLSDFTMGFLFMYLFVKPLKAILKESAEVNCSSSRNSLSVETAEAKEKEKTGDSEAVDGRRDYDPIRSAAFKYTLVTYVAMSSTMAGLLFLGITKHGSVIMCDLLANMACLALMTHWFDAYFTALCCLPLTCVEHCSACQFCCGVKSVDENGRVIGFSLIELTTLNE